MTRHHRKHKKRKGHLFILFQWHRRLGLSVAVIVVFLTITGLLLNHTKNFQLDTTFVKNSLLYSWYGIRLPEKQHYFKVRNHYISQVGEAVFLDAQRFPVSVTEIKGVAWYQDMWLIVEKDQLYLLDKEGNLIEKLSKNSGLPANIIGITIRDYPILVTQNSQFISKDDFISWERQAPIATLSNTATITLPTSLQHQIRQQFFAQELSWERVLLDLHTGRFWGTAGVWIIDISAGIFLLLAGSGFMIWWRKKRQRYHGKKK